MVAAEMWDIFSPLMAKQCIAFQNGSEGKQRRRTYDASFSHQSMHGFYEGMIEVSLPWLFK